MVQTTYPGDANAFRDEWPLVANGDGIVDDYLGDAYTVTTSGSSPTVTVGPGTAGLSKCRVAGFAHVLDAGVTLNLSTVPGATEPGSGQKRVDLVVVRYDWSVSDPDLAATVAIHAGAPVAAAAPLLSSAPAPTRLRGSIWEYPIRAVSRPSGGVVNAGEDMRGWAGDFESVSAETPLSGPIGSVRLRKGRLWVRTGPSTWYDTTTAGKAKGTYSGTVPANFAINVVHGLGFVPNVQITKRATLFPEVDAISDIIVTAISSTNFQVVVRRSGSPTGEPLGAGNAVYFDWLAQ